MVVEEFVVIVRGQNGKGKRQFTYFADPRKKPNAETVLRDFRLESQIEDERHWRLCTLTGKEIRWLTDYADRVLVLEPTSNGHTVGPGEAGLPKLATPSPKLKIRAQALPSYDLNSSGSTAILVSTKIMDTESPDRGLNRRKPQHRSESSSIASVTSSTPKLPSLSISSGSGSNFLSSSSGSGGKISKDSQERLSRVAGVLPKARDSRPSYVDSGHRNGKSEHTGKRRERSR